jgi:hypothetical protein
MVSLFDEIPLPISLYCALLPLNNITTLTALVFWIKTNYVLCSSSSSQTSRDLSRATNVWSYNNPSFKYLSFWDSRSLTHILGHLPLHLSLSLRSKLIFRIPLYHLSLLNWNHYRQSPTIYHSGRCFPHCLCSEQICFLMCLDFVSSVSQGTLIYPHSRSFA